MKCFMKFLTNQSQGSPATKRRDRYKGSKDLNVPDKAHPVAVVLTVAAITTDEVHVPSVVCIVL